MQYRLFCNSAFFTRKTTMSNRRKFIVQFSLASGAFAAAASSTAFAQGAMVDEKDAQAVALGYKADGTKTDKVKYPKYAATQNCSNCALYQGKAEDKAGACPLFAGKQVAAKGWCSAWAKKA
jgi:High potential iron-sulfur protein